MCFVLTCIFEFLAPLKRPRPGDMRSTDLRAAHGELLNICLCLNMSLGYWTLVLISVVFWQLVIWTAWVLDYAPLAVS